MVGELILIAYHVVVLDTIEFPFKLPDFRAICIHLLVGARPVFIELVYCNTPAQGLIGLIGYSYQQVATSFLEAHLLRTPRLSVFGLERWVTDREVLPGAHE